MKKILVLLFVCSVALVGCNKPGCRDPLAANYDLQATTDDGSCIYLPTISTIPITDTNANSASSGGIISSDGGQAITLRGLCWSTSPNPTIANDTTINGSGTGTFSSNISGLSGFTTYYVRAYATNINGTGYGDELSFKTWPQIGMTHKGGIVFALNGNGGGLVAAPFDQSLGAEWGCRDSIISGADGIVIGTGYQNTIDIEAGCTTAGTAADICANLSLNGYDDWFLPSRDELFIMWKHIGQGNFFGLGNIGGFGNFYWSSTEYTYYSATSIGFNGQPTIYNYDDKDNLNLVRAIRTF